MTVRFRTTADINVNDRRHCASAQRIRRVRSRRYRKRRSNRNPVRASGSRNIRRAFLLATMRSMRSFGQRALRPH